MKQFKDNNSDSNINDSSGESQNRLPRILFEDATIQALSLDISQGEKSVLLSSSEGGTIFGGIGMKGENLMGSLAFLNKAWDAEPQAMTRKQAQSSHIDHYRLSSLISTQKESLQEWLSKSIGLAEGMGFLARFLICIPRSQIGHRSYVKAPSSTPCLDRFVSCSINSLKKKADLKKPLILTLSHEAHKIWVDYFNTTEKAQATGCNYEDHTATASKSAEQAVRIASIFTLFGNDDAVRVEAEEMHSAIGVAEWFLNESLKLKSELTMPKSRLNSILLLEWINSYDDRYSPLKLSDLLRIGPNRLRNIKLRDETIKSLIKHGWIQVKKWQNVNIILKHPKMRSEKEHI